MSKARGKRGARNDKKVAVIAENASDEAISVDYPFASPTSGNGVADLQSALVQHTQVGKVIPHRGAASPDSRDGFAHLLLQKLKILFETCFRYFSKMNFTFETTA